ncbi:unnamed protein product [Amoebophrya sp. A120]|nr:unnamed protein product [Amoebophrya sp. A120]|eukprot:GSA120T00004933001.1
MNCQRHPWFVSTFDFCFPTEQTSPNGYASFRATMLRAVKLVDAHTHLHMCPLAVQAATVESFSHLAVCATSPGDWETVLELAEARNPQQQGCKIVPYLGVHPWWAKHNSTERTLADLRRLLEQHPRLQVGEIGLDKIHGKRRKDFPAQKELFRKQLLLAGEFSRGVQVHCVQSGGGIVEEYDAVVASGSPGAQLLPVYTILHSYILGPDLVPLFLQKIPNVYFSFAYHNKPEAVERLRATLRKVPLDRILVETDSPAQTPDVVPVVSAEDDKTLEFCEEVVTSTENDGSSRFQFVTKTALQPDGSTVLHFCPCCGPSGRRDNKPENIRFVLEQVGSILEKSAAEVAEIVARNAERIFSDDLSTSSPVDRGKT